MRLLPSLALLTLALTFGPAVAQPKVDCANPMSTPERNYCTEQELERADRLLNEAYRRTLVRIDASDLEPKIRGEWKRALQDAQRKWIAFRDADCDDAVGYDFYRGTGATAAVLACKLAKTTGRTRELRERSDR